jgi:putative Mg2+ transporter-C (MgtC) family protein
MDAVWSELGIGDISSATIIPLVLRLSAAAFLAGLIGWERERGGHNAGLRTHIIVGLGAALFTIVPLLYPGTDRPDLANIVKGLAAGIGFIGGGTILKDVERQSVEGLTTAAAVWLTAAVGLAAAAGMYLAASLATLVALIVLRPLRAVEAENDDRRPEKSR